MSECEKLPWRNNYVNLRRINGKGESKQIVGDSNSLFLFLGLDGDFPHTASETAPALPARWAGGAASSGTGLGPAAGRTNERQRRLAAGAFRHHSAVGVLVRWLRPPDEWRLRKLRRHQIQGLVPQRCKTSWCHVALLQVAKGVAAASVFEFFRPRVFFIRRVLGRNRFLSVDLISGGHCFFNWPCGKAKVFPLLDSNTQTCLRAHQDQVCRWKYCYLK